MRLQAAILVAEFSIKYIEFKLKNKLREKVKSGHISVPRKI